MLCPVKDINISVYALRRDEVGILGHIPCPVNLSFVVDLLNDVDARLWRDGMAPQLAAVVVVVGAIEFVCRWTIITFGKVDFRDLEVVLSLTRGVRAEEEAVDRVRLIRRSDSV